MMKCLAATAFALSLLGGASALADPNSSNPHSNNGGTGGAPHTGGAGAAGSHTGASGAPHSGGAPGGAPSGGSAAVVGGAHGSGAGSSGARTGAFIGYPGGWRGAPNGQGGGNPGGGSNNRYIGQGSGSPGGSPNSQGGANPHGGYQGHDWRGGDGNGGDRGDWRTGRDFHPGFGAPGFQPGGQRPRYSQQYFPHSFSLDRRYHWRGDWRAPPGFYNRHWSYGDRLPWGWFSQSYWIDDYYDYSLPVPPYGYEWIRVGEDAVLVDISSGTVVETVPDAFY